MTLSTYPQFFSMISLKNLIKFRKGGKKKLWGLWSDSFYTKLWCASAVLPEFRECRDIFRTKGTIETSTFITEYTFLYFKIPYISILQLLECPDNVPVRLLTQTELTCKLTAVGDLEFNIFFNNMSVSERTVDWAVCEEPIMLWALTEQDLFLKLCHFLL